jgi:hypothetical protein
MWRSRGGWRDVAGVGSVLAFAFAYLSPALRDGLSFGSFDLVLGVTSLGAGLYPGPPWNRYNSDIVSQMVPWNAVDWRQIHAGHFPLWNDLTLLGVPHFLNFESAVLSLPDLVSYLVPLRMAFLVAVGVKLVIAGTGAYVLSRVIGLGAPASAFAGITFMLSGAFANWVTWPLSDVVAWTGWLVALGILAYRDRARARYVVLLAVAVALFIYGGFPEANIFVVFGLVVLTIGAVGAALAARRRLSWRGGLRVVGGAGAGLLLAAPLWLPGLQLVHIAHRSTEVRFPGLPTTSLVQTVAAGFYGLPTTPLSYQIYGLNYYEVVSYLGVIAIILALVGVVRWWRQPVVFGIALLIVAELLVSYKVGPFGPVQRLLNHYGFSSVEWLRARSVVGLPIGVLGAIGLETLFKEPRKRANLVTFAAATAAFSALVLGLWVDAEVATSGAVQSAQEQSLIWPTAMLGLCLLALGVLLWRSRSDKQPSPAAGPSQAQAVAPAASGGDPRSVSRRRIAAGALVALGLANCAFLLFAGVGMNTYSHRFYPQTPAITTLLAKVGTGTVGIDDGETEVVQAVPRTGFYPESNLGYSLAQFNGHDPVLPQVYFSTFGSGPTITDGPASITPLINSAALARTYGVQWILVAPGIPAPPGTVYVTTVAGQRLYSVPGAKRFSFLPPRPLSATHGAGAVRSVSQPSPSHYVLHVHTTGPATLVIRVTNVPGWHATVDGHSVPIRSYGRLMMSITVPSGTHVVVLDYFPSRLRLGILMALAAVVFLAGFALVLAVSRRRRPLGGWDGSARSDDDEDFSLRWTPA